MYVKKKTGGMLHAAPCAFSDKNPSFSKRTFSESACEPKRKQE
jgi:hypothetical protein